MLSRLNLGELRTLDRTFIILSDTVPVLPTCHQGQGRSAGAEVMFVGMECKRRHPRDLDGTQQARVGEENRTDITLRAMASYGNRPHLSVAGCLSGPGRRFGSLGPIN